MNGKKWVSRLAMVVWAFVFLMLHQVLALAPRSSCSFGPYPNTTGVGFTCNGSAGGATSASISGTITGEAGKTKSGTAIAWDRKNWSCTHPGGTNPNWRVQLGGKVQAKVSLSGSVPSKSTTYHADAYGSLYFEGYRGQYLSNYSKTATASTVNLDPEDTSEHTSYGEFDRSVAYGVDWDGSAFDLSIWYKVNTGGAISTNRGEIVLHSDASLLTPIEGVAQAKDGATVIDSFLLD